jgi:hypothetical protein
MVIAAARHFVKHVAGALAEQPPQRWHRNSGGADGVRGGGIQGEGGDIGGRGSRGERAARAGRGGEPGSAGERVNLANFPGPTCKFRTNPVTKLPGPTCKT